jgi:hypothetical protein
MVRVSKAEAISSAGTMLLYRREQISTRSLPLNTSEIAHHDKYSLLVCLLTKGLICGIEKSTVLASLLGHGCH